MHRAARSLPALLLCVSAIAATLWLRSYCAYDQVRRDTGSAFDAAAGHGRPSLLSARGTIYFFRSVERVQLQEPPASRPISSVSEWKPTPAWRETISVDSLRAALRSAAPAWERSLARLGLAYSHEQEHKSNRGDWPRGPIDHTLHRGSVPYWLLVAAPLCWPALLLARRTTRAWVGRRRRRAGRCAGCGYELRGSTGRCPECGRANDTRGVDPAPLALGALRRSHPLTTPSRYSRHVRHTGPRRQPMTPTPCGRPLCPPFPDTRFGRSCLERRTPGSYTPSPLPLSRREREAGRRYLKCARTSSDFPPLPR
jgi:hypothetical protein